MNSTLILTLNLLNLFNSIIHLQLPELSIIIFRHIKIENLMLVSQQKRAWSDCTDVQAGLTVYWWQRLITFGFGRIRVNYQKVTMPVCSKYKTMEEINLIYCISYTLQCSCIIFFSQISQNLCIRK